MWMERIFDAVVAITAVIAIILSVKANSKAEKANEIAAEANEISKKVELAAFDPIFEATDPIRVVEDGQSGGRLKLALVSTIVISNKGALAGCVADLVVVLEILGTGSKRRFVPHYFANSERFLQVLREGNKPRVYKAHESRFSPVIVLRKQHIDKTIVFRNVRFYRKDIRPGTYVLELMGRYCGDRNGWQRMWRATYRVEAEEAKDVIRGRATAFDSEERINAIRKLQ